MRINTLNWYDLNYFLEIARERTLSGAATRLGVTHSTVFRRINSLESNMEVKLFARKPDGYHLTEIGKEVMSHAMQVKSHIDELDRLLGSRNSEMYGEINITAPHNLAYRFMPGYVSRFCEMYPNIKINLMVSNKEYNLSRLEADLVIRATSNPPLDLIARKLFSLQWGAYASQEYIQNYGHPQCLDDLKKHNMISSDQVLEKLPAYSWIDDNVPRINIILRCNDLVSMSAYTVAGLGVALLPDDQAKPELCRLFELPKTISSDIWLLIHPDIRNSARLIAFRDFLIKSFREDTLFQQYGIVDKHEVALT